MRRRAVPLAALAIVLAPLVGAPPAQAAPSYALPETVRINIGLDGTSYAIVSATGPFVVRTPDGREVWRDAGRLAVRTSVLRLAEGETPIPRGRVDPEERPQRVALIREARLADRLGPRAILRIPFELEALAGDAEALGRAIYRAERVTGLRLAPADQGLLLLNGRGYRGTFEITEATHGFTIINTVPTDRYLVSVLGSEVPTDWHPQALAAQVIAARTYLVKHLGSHGTYDLEGDERDQAYKGIHGETESTERAVARTAGLIATYRGAVIDAFYSANAGGFTENSENVWVTPLPYLRSVPSPGDAVALRSSWGATSYEWTKEFTEPALRRQLERTGVVLGTIQSIDILEKTASGGVVRARVRGTFGTRDILKDSTRWYFSLKSQLFTVQFRPASELEVVAVDDRTRLGDLGGLGAERTSLVMAAQAVESDGAFVVTGFKTSHYLYRLPARIVFTGKGYGHRVGMSQWGMHGMALSGANYEEILKHYYRGIGLTQIPGP